MARKDLDEEEEEEEEEIEEKESDEDEEEEEESSKKKSKKKDKKQELKLIVVKELPAIQTREIELESGEKATLITVEEALAEILSILKKKSKK